MIVPQSVAALFNSDMGSICGANAAWESSKIKLLHVVTYLILHQRGGNIHRIQNS